MDQHVSLHVDAEAPSSQKTGLARFFAPKNRKQCKKQHIGASEEEQSFNRQQRPRLPPRPGNGALSRSEPILQSSSRSEHVRSLAPRPTGGGFQIDAMVVESADQALSNRLSCQLEDLITAMDFGRFSDDHDNVDTQRHSIARPDPEQPTVFNLGVRSASQRDRLVQHPEPRQVVFSGYFNKVNLYANSRLPPVLPPLKLYIPTYPLLCLAAQHSLAVYSPEQSMHPFASSTSMTLNFPASARMGTKAMTISATSLDTSDMIVLAIRGSASFTDWGVNFRPTPVSPVGFLDDEGNACHGGFLEVAKSMIDPIATRLSDLLARRASKSRNNDASLMLTGHSAGGAVASLLFAHMLSTSPSVSSKLTSLAQSCKRIHCIVFGVPPVSLLPLQRPAASHLVSSQPSHSVKQLRIRKSLFFSFINEGDPVARAEIPYMKSLLGLMTSPKPQPGRNGHLPIWPIPQGTLSCAGRLVLLRRNGQSLGSEVKVKGKGILKSSTIQVNEVYSRGLVNGQPSNSTSPQSGEKVEAFMIADEDLRGVVFGDPLMHSMRLYAQRIEALAVGAVTGGIHIN